MKGLGRVLIFAAFCFTFLRSTDRFSAEKKNAPTVKRARDQSLALDRNVRWALTWEAGYPNSITPTDDGGFIINASVYSAGAGWDIWLIKVDSAFGTEWQNTYGAGGNDGRSNCTVRQTPDGGYLVYSDTNSFGMGRYDFWLLRLSATGAIIWQRTYGTVENEIAHGEIQPTSDGGYFVIGTIFRDFDLSSAIWVLKIDANGNIVWQKAYGDPDYSEIGYSILQTTYGGYIIAGSQSIIGTSNYRPIVIKITATADIQWQRTFGDFENRFFPLGTGSWETNFLPSVREAAGGGYYLVDDTFSQSAGLKDVWVIKLSAAGTVIWQKLYGGAGHDWGRHALPVSDGGCLIAAESSSFGSSPRNVWLFEIDSSGNIEWQKTYCANGGSEESFCVESGQDGDYLVIGSTSHRQHDGIFLLKISPTGDLGPCAWVNDTNAKVTVPTIPSVAASAIVDATAASQTTTMVSPEATNSSPQVLCWTLNQPPANIIVTQEANRSLFTKEYYNTLNWGPEPWNSQFTLSSYRIYRRGVFTSEYQFLASLPATAFGYLDGPVDAKVPYEYALTSVDSKGRESPKSAAVQGQ